MNFAEKEKRRMCNEIGCPECYSRETGKNDGDFNALENKEVRSFSLFVCGEAQNHGTVEIVVVDGAVAGTIFNFFFR